MKLPDRIKNIIYGITLFLVRIYWRVFKPQTRGAKLFLVTDTKIFLVQPRTMSYWSFPGGGINKNESPEQAVIRELYEEVGIRIDSIDYLLGTYTTSDEGKRDTVYLFVKKVDQELAAYPDMEIGRAGWFGFDHLPEGVTSRVRMRIQEYQAGKRDIYGLYKDLHI